VAPAGEQCSDENLARMRQIDLASKYMQAIGYVNGGRIVCSSLGRDSKDLVLGQPDFISPNGGPVYKNLRFSFAPQETFIAFGPNDYVAIIHKDLPIDITTTELDVSLAVFSLLDPEPMTSRGFIDSHWITRLGAASAITFVDGGYLVAVTRSARFRTAAVAAIPIKYLNSRTRALAWRLVPVGVIAGIVLAVAVFMLASTQLAIPAAIRGGLKKGEFFLVYQPIVDMRTGGLVGAEALLRWKRAGGELVQPDFFIPLAEANGIIGLITQQVFDLVARDAGTFLSRHPDFHIAVNLSAADMHSPTLRGQLDRLVERTGASSRSIIVEITERSLLNADLARDVTHDIRALGYDIAIDDFGTGYSSLSYLATLEVDYLKIDKIFIDAIGTEAPTSYVVQHIIEMAKSLKLRMIAEGVETEAQADFLRQRGVEFAQGWLFGKPMPFAELERRMAESAIENQT
jgi:sensor c-di-GMP phosphodiesterase-like protein